MTQNPIPNPSPQSAPRVQRQIVLPLSKAAEIAWKSIRLRLSRSLLVTSGIVLALAFLMSIRVNDAILDGMRHWIHAASQPLPPGAPAPPAASVEAQFAKYRQDEASLRDSLAALQDHIRRAADAPLPKPTASFDIKQALGDDLPTLQKQLGTLPATPEKLSKALPADPTLLTSLRQWIADRRHLKALQETIGGPQRLAAMMQANGVPTTPAEISAGQVRTRWLLSLALLVAFVGILNSMLMSVTERFREIGTMKCLGALDSFIIKLFLIESLFQGFVGTLIGVALGILLSAIAAIATYHSFAWMNPPWHDIAISALISLAIGIGLTVAGAVYPAWQAARMQPIDAMRAEA